MSDEVWKRIGGMPYEVSSHGNVRRLLKDGSPAKANLRAGLSGGGLSYVVLSHERRQATHYVHVLVCNAFHGPPPEARSVPRWHDGDRANNHESNLFWGTHPGPWGLRRGQK